VTDFVNDLTYFDDKLEKLHHLVAITKPSDHLANGGRMRYPSAIIGLPSKNHHLPRSLVYAFEELLVYYLLAAKRIDSGSESFAKHDDSQDHSWINRQLHHTRICVCHYLEQAAPDICVFPVVVDTPGRRDDPSLAMDIQPFRSEILAVVVRLSVLRTSIPTTASKRFLEAVSTNRGTTKEDELDVVAMYMEYCQRLRSEAFRRPRRRLFLDITGLLDELLLLDMLLKQQIMGFDR
jgi:hypothetical protein